MRKLIKVLNEQILMKRLNFGCGLKTLKGWDNVDIQKGKGISKSFDFNRFPYPLKPNNYDLILLDNVLEHLLDPQKVLEELWGVGKNGATIKIIVPHYTNKGAYSDLEHIHFFNEICFKNLVDRTIKTDQKKKFELDSLEISPTLPGKFFPRRIREKLALFFNGFLSQIIVVLKVIK